jgi:hypothetical protein
MEVNANEPLLTRKSNRAQFNLDHLRQLITTWMVSQPAQGRRLPPPSTNISEER